MAATFIGKPISLISHSDVRYRGILAGIDPQASTIQLSNVFSMGTETRRPPNQFIAPVHEPYTYIIFRASEVKDLAVDEQVPPVQQHSVLDDPAVIGSSAHAPPPNAYSPYPASNAPNGAPKPHVHLPPPYPGASPQQQQQQQPPPLQAPQGAAVAPTAASVVRTGTQQQQPQPQQPQVNINTARRPNPVHTAAASLQSVERALGDLRVSTGGGGAPAHNPITAAAHRGRRGGHNGRGGGRGGGHHGHAGGEAEHLTVPTTDFDFESSNARFDKAAAAPHSAIASKTTSENGADEAGSGTQSPAEKEREREKEPPAYNPQKSFFDSLSSGSGAGGSGPGPNSGSGGPSGQGGNGGRGGGGGRRGGGGRNRREEEREKNVATFGEPGGVGLLGPGGYVGGWGGYGRRGGRPRRGAGGGNGGRGGGGGGAPPAVQARG